MPRRPVHPPLRVFLNGEPVGRLSKEPSGAVSFQYAESWMAGAESIPVSLSLPLREESFRGLPVQAVFENLLPDSEALRRLVAEKVGAAGDDAFSLLTRIGRDCVGALQFVPEGEEIPTVARGPAGEPLNAAAIETILNNLGKTPLGVDGGSEFRISIAGAQEKTALHFDGRRWMKPHGTTPTTHILKTQIGALPNGLDLSNSVENEFYCLKLFAAFGLSVAAAEIKTFRSRTVLAVERFDRRRLATGRWLRVPQEDCCQALSVPPSRKYQNQGGPGIAEILDLLNASDTPREDQLAFLKAQMLFWLIGAPDGHAKKFSLFLGPRGRFRLAPIYDVISAQPCLERRQIRRNQLAMAMFVGANRHYRHDEIEGRHFAQTVKKARLPQALATQAFEEIAASANGAIAAAEKHLPANFPPVIRDAIVKGLLQRLRKI